MSSPNRPPITFAPTLEVPGADMHLRLASMDHVEELAATFRRGGEALAEFIPQARQLTTVEGATQLTEVVWGLQTVYAMAAVDNARSQGALRRLGFQLLGRDPFVDEEGLRQTGVRQMVHMWSKKL